MIPITLYTFGARFGAPDSSPFCLKAMVLLRMSGLPFVEDHKGFGKAPKGKLPFIDDDGTLIEDSTFIRMHLERAHGIDFDAGLTQAERATGWIFGDEPHGADASLFGSLASLLMPDIQPKLKALATPHANLQDFVARMLARYFPDFRVG